jgi:hypothetical protein
VGDDKPLNLEAIDAEISPILVVIAQEQTAYYLSHGRYFQGLSTHSEPPSDGLASTAELANSKPTDQAESWLDWLKQKMPTTLPYAMRIDVYDGPRGHGYTITFQVVIEGINYTRQEHVGPESDRIPETGWQKVELGLEVEA